MPARNCAGAAAGMRGVHALFTDSAAWEVEQKFPLSDPAAMRTKLSALGAEFKAPIEQIDNYLNHPARDFAQTDEALRLRHVGDENALTYKGPKLGTVAKTRREIEVPLAGGSLLRDQYLALFQTLGFRSVAAVHKLRVP